MTPNIVKGSGITGAYRYCLGEGNEPGAEPGTVGRRKELEPGATSRATILGGLNFGFEVHDEKTAELARRMMEWQGLPANQHSRTRPCRQDCLHASLSWEPGETPSDAVMMEAARSFMKALGMEGALAVVTKHDDKPYRHIHIVGSRIDPMTGRTYSEKRDFATAQAWALKWERDHGHIPEAKRRSHGIAGVVMAGDHAAICGHLTERNPTFTEKQLERVIGLGGLKPEAAFQLRKDVLRDPEVIGLRASAGGEIARYTTRTVLAQERALQRDARALAAMAGHAVSFGAQQDAARRHNLNPQQAEALFHVSGDGGLALIAGQAGTGKSTALAAVREANEADGFRVVGLGPTNKVKLALEEAGFAHAATVSAELGLHGRSDRPPPAATWDQRTVVVVDEAAMLSTKDLAAVLRRGVESGAKVILAGDGAQLGSMARGGMFDPLVNEHGAAHMTEVVRFSKAELKQASNLMHDGQFRPALDLFAAEGFLHWTGTTRQAEAELAQRYSADVAADPHKSRFIFAHTNEAVDRLNAAARGAARAAGRLGDDHQVVSASGVQTFATGDRIQFTESGRSQAQRDKGFANGATGRVTEIATEQDRTVMTVALDSGKELRFKVGNDRGAFDGFRHGYAGTVHKGQGASIDQVYVLVTKGWDEQLSYVALSRQKETLAVFIPKEIAPDLAKLAGIMGRPGTGAAASAFVDQEAVSQFTRSEFRAAAGAATGQAGPAAAATPRTVPATVAPKVTLGPQKTGKEAVAAKGARTEAAKEGKGVSAAAKAAVGAKVAEGVVKVAAKALDAIADLAEGLLAPATPLTPEEKIEAAKEQGRRDAEALLAEQQVDPNEQARKDAETAHEARLRGILTSFNPPDRDYDREDELGRSRGR